MKNQLSFTGYIFNFLHSVAQIKRVSLLILSVFGSMLGSASARPLVQAAQPLFERQHFGPATNGPTYEVALGDLNNDGALDIVVANRRAMNVMYLNDGGDGFDVGSSVDCDTSRLDVVCFGGDDKATEAVVLGDMDNDGDLDIVTGNVLGSNYVYFNDGQGNLSSGEAFGPAVDTTLGLALGDVDGDGYLDILTANAGCDDAGCSAFVGEQNVAYLNDGTGAFYAGEIACDRVTAVVCLGDGGDLTVSLATGDINGDGHLDVVAGNHFRSSYFYLNDGQGQFDAGQLLGAERYATRTVVLGDLNGDGLLDVVMGNSNGFENQIFFGEGAGRFGPAQGFGTGSDGTWDIALADIEQDGDLDVAVANYFQQSAVYLNGGDGVLQRGAVACNGGTAVLCIGGSQDLNVAVAVGDVDLNGALDVVAGANNFAGPLREQNSIYLNNGAGHLALGRLFGPGDDNSFAVTTADVNGDAFIDLIVSNGRDVGGQNVVYLNDGQGRYHEGTVTCGVTPTVRCFGTGDDDSRTVVGDVDNDGDFDLVVANVPVVQDGTVVERGQNAVYLNDGAGHFHFGALDCGAEQQVRCFGGGLDQSGVVLGDVDDDGYLDLIVSNHYEDFAYEDVGLNAVYLNDGNGRFYQGEIDCTSVEVMRCFGAAGLDFAMAVGDVDVDGDLDIVGATYNVTNDARSPNLVFYNDGSGHFVWQDVGCDGVAGVACFGGLDPTGGIALADLDGDGLLDIVVGNDNSQNIVYLNDGFGGYRQGVDCGSSELIRCFGTGTDNTFTVAVGDMDGNGSQDIVATNWDLQKAVYLNDGLGHFDVRRTFGAGHEHAQGGVVGDVENDGNLDMITVGFNFLQGENGGRPNYVFPNQRHWTGGGTDQPTRVWLEPPAATPNGIPYASSEVLRGPIIPVTYALIDEDGDAARSVRAYYSVNGGGQWLPATPTEITPLDNLSAAPWPGARHIFEWQADADLIKSDYVLFRIEAYPSFTDRGSYAWGRTSSQSLPFRVEPAAWFARVTNVAGQALDGAVVYQAGHLVAEQGLDGPAYSDRAGLVRLNSATVGESLVALWPVVERGTARAVHDGWSSRTYLTNLSLDEEGGAQPARVGVPGKQTLQVGRDQSLTLFNVVVSVEWDADDAYLAMVARGFERASDYLYDVTDGQMAFGLVHIYDKSEHWAQADFQISTKNTVRPYAFVGGVDSEDTAHAIRVGRFWDGSSGDRGGWDEAAGYRTLIHEFGHYALYLLDEYFVRTVDENGGISGLNAAACTGIEVYDNELDATNASIMYYQYNASELADGDRWGFNCQQTEQARVNGEPDWETVVRYYGDGQDEPRWVLNTPVSRGSVMAGPEQFPRELLPFPEIEVYNEGGNGSAKALVVFDPQGIPLQSALVALYTRWGSRVVAIDQGLTSERGELPVYGAAESDIIQVASLDGRLAGSVVVDERERYEITLEPVGRQQRKEEAVPYLNIVPGSEGDSLIVEVHGAAASGFTLDAYVFPGEGGGDAQTAPLLYDAEQEAYVGQVSFAGVGLGSGEVRVTGVAGGQPIRLNSNYNLTAVYNDAAADLTSEDGNFQLHVTADSLLNGADGYGTVVPSGFVPRVLPEGQQVLGSAYVVRLSGAATHLEKPGLLTMHYHPDVVGVAEEVAIYYWDVGSKRWQQVGGLNDGVSGGVSASVSRLGVYVLGGVLTSPHKVFLPVIPYGP